MCLLRLMVMLRINTSMTAVFSVLDPLTLLICLAVAMLAGVVKGMVGFAMPMILVSALSSFLTPELALAGLILPTVVTNGFQELRQGLRPACAHPDQ